MEFGVILSREKCSYGQTAPNAFLAFKENPRRIGLACMFWGYLHARVIALNLLYAYINPDTAECAATYSCAAAITASFSFASTNEPSKVIAMIIDMREKARARRATAVIFIRLLFLHNVAKDQ